MRDSNSVGQAAVELDHGELDQIGGGALHRRIHRGALGKIAQVGLRRIDFGNRPDAAEERLGESGLADSAICASRYFFTPL